jgi:nicotine blue oxidoreductase
MDLPLTGIVLAAGPGTKFGGPKALASFGDENCATLCVRKLRGGGMEDIVIVTGAGAADVAESLVKSRLTSSNGVRVVENPDWTSGLFSSVAAGLLHVSPTAIGALFLPVHFPLVGEETVALLCQLFAQEPGAEGKVMVPLFEGRIGFPVIIGRSIFGELASACSDEPLGEITRAVPARVTAVGIEDEGSVLGIETRDDYMQAMRRLADEEYQRDEPGSE